jgi:hypothetical protein
MVTIPLFAADFFLIDCSSIITFSGADYVNPNRFLNYREKIWNHIETMIDAGKLKTVPQLWDELEYNDPASYEKLKVRRKKFTVDPDKDTDSRVIQLLFKYPSLLEHGVLLHYTREPADPFLIDYAQTWKASIIADEKRLAERTGMKHKKVLKIPDVCDIENIPCICLEKYLKDNGVIPPDAIV